MKFLWLIENCNNPSDLTSNHKYSDINTIFKKETILPSQCENSSFIDLHYT